MRIRKLITTIAFVILLFHSLSAGLYQTVADGDWGATATWGGVYVSSFFPAPPTPPNWFTQGALGAPDTIIISHNVTMDYNIFIRDSDVLIIDPSGSLTAGGATTNSSLYNLSNGDPGCLISGIQAGVFVQGDLNVEYFRNSATFAVIAGGFVNVSIGVGGSGNFDDFGDCYIEGDVIVENILNNNAGDIFMYDGATITITSGEFFNRSVLQLLFTTSCISVELGSFYNSAGGFVTGVGNVNAFLDIDNSANPAANWLGPSWCSTTGSGINVPAIDEDCAHPCITAGDPCPYPNVFAR